MATSYDDDRIMYCQSASYDSACDFIQIKQEFGWKVLTYPMPLTTRDQHDRMGCETVEWVYILHKL